MMLDTMDPHRLKFNDLGMDLSRRALLWWFSVVSLCSIGLSLPMLFSCSSTATSSLFLVSMQTDRIVTSRLALLRDTGVNLADIFGTSQISEASFFANPLPHKYLYGVSGVCRQWVISDTSSAVHTTCERRFFPQVDLLRYVAEDLKPTPSSDVLVNANSTNSGRSFPTSPNTPVTPSTQLGYWVSLLNANFPDSARIDFGYWESVRARNAHVAAALLATSIPIAFITLIATIVLQPPKFSFSFYAKGSVIFDLLDFILVAISALEWTLLWVQAETAYGGQSVLYDSGTPSGVRLGWGFLLLWLAAVIKLFVTPLMMFLTIFWTLVIATWLFWCFIKLMIIVVCGGSYDDDD